MQHSFYGGFLFVCFLSIYEWGVVMTSRQYLEGPICEIPTLSNTNTLGWEFGLPLTKSVSI